MRATCPISPVETDGCDRASPSTGLRRALLAATAALAVACGQPHPAPPVPFIAPGDAPVGTLQLRGDALFLSRPGSFTRATLDGTPGVSFQWPKPLASAPAVNGTSVYWVDTDGVLNRAAHDGTSLMPLTETSVVLKAFAATDDGVWWVSFSSTTHVTLAHLLEGAAAPATQEIVITDPPTHVPTLTFPRPAVGEFLVSGSEVLFTLVSSPQLGAEQDTVYRADLQTGVASQLFAAAVQSGQFSEHLSGLSKDGNQVFVQVQHFSWASVVPDWVVLRLLTTPGGDLPLPGWPNSQTLAAGKLVFTWTNQVLVADTASPGPLRTAVEAPEGTVESAVSDGSTLYWSTWKGVFKAPLAP